MLPLSNLIVAEGVESPRTERSAPWPTRLHAVKEEKRRKEEEEEKKKIMEEERDGDMVASLSPGLLVEGAPVLDPQQRQQQPHMPQEGQLW